MLSEKPGKQNPLTALFTEAFDSLIRSVMICLPGEVVSFDESTQLAQVSCGIKRVINGEGVAIPVIENVPVHFPGDGEWYFWHQILPGTEGLIHFSQRAIDLWLERGGTVTPHDLRVLSAEDAFFTPGYRSKPGAIPAFKNEGIGMSNYSGEDFIHIKLGTIEIQTTNLKITADNTEHIGNIDHTGDLNRTGNSILNGDVTTTGGLTNDGKNVGSDHKHGDTQPGNGETGEPI